MAQISENNPVIIHKQLISQYQMLYCPYKIYRAAIQRSKLPTSKQIACKINKYLAIMGQVNILILLEAMGKLQSDEQIEIIEATWSVMAAITPLIILFMRLRQKNSITDDYQNNHCQSEILLQTVKDGKKTAIEVEVRTDRKIKKESLAKIIYSFIKRQSQKYCLNFSQTLSSSKLTLSSKNRLFLGHFQYPCILQLQGTDKPACTLVLRPSKHQEYSLGFSEYFKLRDWVSQSRQFEQEYLVSQLAKVYCEYFEKHIEQKSKAALYYCMITPEEILVIDEPNLQFKIKIEPSTIYVGSDSLMPKPFHTNIYSDRQRPVPLDKIDRWSLGLSLLCVISRYENENLFNAQLERAVNSEKVGQFVVDLMERIEGERQFDLDIVMGTLSKWLRIDYLTKKIDGPISNILIGLSGTGGTLTKNTDPELKKAETANVEWVKDILYDSKLSQSSITQNKELLQTPKEPWLQPNVSSKGQTQTLSLIKSIKQNKRLEAFSANLNVNKFVNSNLQSYTQKKPIVIHGKAIQIDIQGTTSQKITSQVWKKYQAELNDILVKIAEVQKELTKFGTISLVFNADKDKYNFIAIKLSEKREKQLGVQLCKDISRLEALGYHLSQPQQLIEKCSKCVTKQKIQDTKKPQSKQSVILNHCGHGQCLKCWLKYIEPSAKRNRIDKILCFHPGCNKKVSYMILKQVMSKSTEIQMSVYHKLARIYSRTTIKHCFKRTCEQAAAIYQISQENQMFYCQICDCYICCKCNKDFHGAFPCDTFKDKQKQFQEHAEQQMAALLKVKIPKKKINTVSLSKLLKELKISDQLMIFQLQALLRACIVQVYGMSERVTLEGSKLKILTDVIPFLRDNLVSFYSAIQDLGSQTDRQIKQTAFRMRQAISNLLGIKKYLNALLFYACFK